MDVEWLPRSYIELARQHGVKIKILSRNEEEARVILKKVSFDFQTNLIERKQYGDYTYYVVNITP
jgi:ribosome biogenesis SPOUT family RNA methylase Rps3